MVWIMLVLVLLMPEETLLSVPNFNLMVMIDSKKDSVLTSILYNHTNITLISQ